MCKHSYNVLASSVQTKHKAAFYSGTCRHDAVDVVTACSLRRILQDDHYALFPIRRTDQSVSCTTCFIFPGDGALATLGLLAHVLG